MALADWETYVGNATVNLDTLNTIIGSSSLRIIGTSGASGGIVNILPSRASLRPHALTRGKLRTLIKPVVLGTQSQAGISCLQSLRDIRNFGFFYIAQTDHLSNSILLGKGSSGLDSATTTLGSSSYTMVAGTTFALELQWEVLIDEINGVDLVVRLGALTDFSDLTDIIHYIDVSSPNTISRGEGIMYNTGATVSNNIEFRYDQTSLYRIL